MVDTIYALCSGIGRAGVAVVRISGPDSGLVVLAIAGGPLPEPRRATLRMLRDPCGGEVLDQALVLWFPGSASFTGMPSAEFQVHGSRAVLQGLLRAIGRCDGVRMAEAGEFARVAFENGKLDLPQVEALADLIDAETAAQRRQALAGLDGALGAAVAQWRSDLLEARALIAAEIDFSDEGDVGDAPSAGIDSLLERIRSGMADVLAGASRSRIVADGLRVAIIGRPNCGKSTLLNVLSGSDAAIVTEHAGTTRDVISVKLDWDGYPVVLSDTAGLRTTSDPVEAIGIGRALEEAKVADVVLHLDDRGCWDEVAPAEVFGELIRVRTKIDLAAGDISRAELAISSQTGSGLDELRQRLLQQFQTMGPVLGLAAAVRERQVQALSSALAACRRAICVASGGVELLDHEVRACESALEILMGRVGVEDVLGAVFSRFCVGK
jgi:tRNA modification GTPase